MNAVQMSSQISTPAYKAEFCLGHNTKRFVCIPDQKGGYQQKQSYQRGMFKHIRNVFGVSFYFFNLSAKQLEQGLETGLVPIILFSGLFPDQKSGYQQNKGGYQRGGYRNQNQSNY